MREVRGGGGDRKISFRLAVFETVRGTSATVSVNRKK